MRFSITMSSERVPMVATGSVASKLVFRRRVIFGILAVCVQMTSVIWADEHNENKSEY